MKAARGLNPGTLLFSVGVSLGAGIFTIWFVWDDIDVYEAVCGAPLAAPLWLMMPLWVIFYLLLGAAVAQVLGGHLPHADLKAAAGRWLLLILVSFAQAAVFFRLEYLTVSFALTALSLALGMTSTAFFSRFSRPAGLCMISCTLWQLYLCYLGLAAAAGI